MNDKEKQSIEEIAKLMVNSDNEEGVNALSMFFVTVAEALYNAGYRKQSENTVEVVRCKDCYYCEKLPGVLGTCLHCSHWCKDVDDDTFCSNGFSMKGGAE